MNLNVVYRIAQLKSSNSDVGVIAVHDTGQCTEDFPHPEPQVVYLGDFDDVHECEQVFGDRGNRI